MAPDFDCVVLGAGVIGLAGQARFGPDTEWVATIHYDIDPARVESFYEAVRQYWPNLPDDSLAPAYTGIRPKIVAAGQPCLLLHNGVPKRLMLKGLFSPSQPIHVFLSHNERLYSDAILPRPYRDCAPGYGLVA